MNLKFDFKLTNIETGTEFRKGDKVKLHLNNNDFTQGEVIIGELVYADGISLSILRHNSDEDYDFGEIESITNLKVI